MCFLSPVLLVLYISDVNCAIVCPAQVNVVQWYIIGACEIYSHAFIQGTWGLFESSQTVLHSAVTYLFIPHPSAHHPKSAACSLKVKWINSPPLFLGVCFHTLIPEESAFCFMAAFVPNANEGQRWEGRASGDCVCWIMSWVLGVHMDWLGTTFRGIFWCITGFSAVSSLDNFLIPIVHSLYNAMWVFCKAILCQFFLHACRSSLLCFFVTLFLRSALIFFSIWCLYESFIKEAALREIWEE